MNVYDFDETIFTGDSEDRFFAFLFKKKGFFWYKLNWKFWNMLLKLKVINKTCAREHEYIFLKKLDAEGNLKNTLEEYWDSVMKYMKPWYNKQSNPETDVIASGTPRFLMEPICRRLGIRGLVATEMDCKTGKITSGKFAVGTHKLENFCKQYSPVEIDNFYSDAWSDHFLAECAKKAYVVHDGEERTEWNEWFSTHPQK